MVLIRDRPGTALSGCGSAGAVYGCQSLARVLSPCSRLLYPHLPLTCFPKRRRRKSAVGEERHCSADGYAQAMQPSTVTTLSLCMPEPDTLTTEA